MDIFQIAVGKLIARLCVFAVPIIDSEVPFGIFSKAVVANELIFLLGRELMLFPAAFTIGDDAALLDELTSILHRGRVEPYGTGSLFVGAGNEANNSENRDCRDEK